MSAALPIVPPDLRPAWPVEIAGDCVRAKLIELLGMGAIPDEVDFATAGVHETDGLRATKLTYANSLGETVPAVLIEPLESAEPERPGIVCVPGTGGSADGVAHPEFRKTRDGSLIGWGCELARRGFTALAISPKGSKARRRSIEHWALEAKLLAPYGRTQMGVLVEETLRAARILGATDGVDAGRIGLTGMSLGGNATWYAMACAPWIAAGAPICGGVGSLAHVIHYGDPERHSAYFYVPGLLRHFDHSRIVAACMPPRPFMMVSPTRDEDMPRAGVEAFVPVVREAYAAARCEERFAIHQPEGNHQFLEEYFKWMADWFDRFLLKRT